MENMASHIRHGEPGPRRAHHSLGPGTRIWSQAKRLWWIEESGRTLIWPQRTACLDPRTEGVRSGLFRCDATQARRMCRLHGVILNGPPCRASVLRGLFRVAPSPADRGCESGSREEGAALLSVIGGTSARLSRNTSLAAPSRYTCHSGSGNAGSRSALEQDALGYHAVE